MTSPDGAPLFGRNFDWEECDKMLVHTIPKNGYESIATCNLNFLGFGEDWKPDGVTLVQRLRHVPVKPYV